MFSCLPSGTVPRGRHVVRRVLLLSGVGISILVMTACLGGGQSRGRGLDDAQGMASYYGDKFAGQTTASGERFDPDEMTAAHPRLPFGTMVRVTRLDGEERSVVVRINDRGPFVDDRIIDVSKAAAQELGMIREGVVEVRVEVLERSEDASEGVGEQW
jgi:rare lipoprotein A